LLITLFFFVAIAIDAALNTVDYPVLAITAARVKVSEW
jgi:hypothetical protein